MPLPLTTTTFTITRSANDGTTDLYDTPAALTTVAEGLRGAVTSPTARTALVRGQRVNVAAGFRSDPADIRTGDTLVDDTTGASYLVLWTLSRYELGITYTYGDLQAVEGAST